jgi:hypothetical protein
MIKIDPLRAAEAILNHYGFLYPGHGRGSVRMKSLDRVPAPRVEYGPATGIVPGGLHRRLGGEGLRQAAGRFFDLLASMIRIAHLRSAAAASG